MKKNLLIVILVVLTIVGCKKKEVEEPATEINYLLGQYVGPLTAEDGAALYLQFLFADGDVIYIPQTGSVSGTGNIYRVAIFAESVDANLFPYNGKYNGNDSFEANTFYCTSNSSANGYTAIMELKDGSIAKTTRIMEGTIDISGNIDNGEFTFKIKDENGVSHSLHYKGKAAVEAVE